MKKNEMKLSFLALPENEAFARTAAAAFVTVLDPTMEELADIRTSVSEAVTNAIIHGYGGDSNKEVELYCKIEETTAEIHIIDSGSGIEDVELAMQPFYTSMPNLERSGMGFAVMEAFMDSVEVRSVPNEGTRVIMKKRISSEKRNEDGNA